MTSAAGDAHAEEPSLANEASESDTKGLLDRTLTGWADHPFFPSLIGAIIASVLAAVPMVYARIYGSAIKTGFSGFLVERFWFVFGAWVLAVFIGTFLLGYSQLKSASFQMMNLSHNVTERTDRLQGVLGEATANLDALKEGTAANVTKLNGISGKVTSTSRVLDSFRPRLEDIADRTDKVVTGTSEVLLSTIIQTIDRKIRSALSEPFLQGKTPRSLHDSEYLVYLVTDNAGHKLVPFYQERHALIASGRLSGPEDPVIIDLLKISQSRATGDSFAWNLKRSEASRLPVKLRNLKEGVTLEVKASDGTRVGVLVVGRPKIAPVFFEPDGSPAMSFGDATDCVANAADDIADLLADARALL